MEAKRNLTEIHLPPVLYWRNERNFLVWIFVVYVTMIILYWILCITKEHIKQIKKGNYEFSWIVLIIF